MHVPVPCMTQLDAAISTMTTHKFTNDFASFILAESCLHEVDIDNVDILEGVAFVGATSWNALGANGRLRHVCLSRSLSRLPNSATRQHVNAPSDTMMGQTMTPSPRRTWSTCTRKRVPCPELPGPVSYTHLTLPTKA